MNRFFFFNFFIGALHIMRPTGIHPRGVFRGGGAKGAFSQQLKKGGGKVAGKLGEEKEGEGDKKFKGEDLFFRIQTRHLPPPPDSTPVYLPCHNQCNQLPLGLKKISLRLRIFSLRPLVLDEKVRGIIEWPNLNL